MIGEEGLCLLPPGCFVLDDVVVGGICWGVLAFLTTGEHMNDHGIGPDGSDGSLDSMGNEDGLVYLARSGDDAGRGV